MQFDHLPELPGIYTIKNRVTGKMYVGSSMNPKKRVSFHLYSLKKGDHHSAKLQNSWNKHGSEVFECNIAESIEYEGKETIDIFAREQFWIDHHDSIANGYNIKNPGVNSVRKVSFESRKNIELIAEDNCIVGNRRCEIRASIPENLELDFIRVCACYGMDVATGLTMAIASLWNESREEVESYEKEKSTELGISAAEFRRRIYGRSKSRSRQKKINLMGGAND